MKKIVALLLVAIMALALVACTPAQQGETTYAIVCKDASNPYMLKMIEGFQKSCDAIGVKYAMIEQDNAVEGSSIDCMRFSYNTLKGLGGRF